MPKRSAGILLHRPGADGPEVLLIRPGGPFWRGKDVGAWQIPKGLVEPGEDDEAAARRETGEELGLVVDGPLVPLGTIRQAGGKHVTAFAAALDFDSAALVSNRTTIEWPPRSGRQLEIAEVEEARWFPIADARVAMLPSQAPLLDRLGSGNGAAGED